MIEAITNPSTDLQLAETLARAGGGILLRDHSGRTVQEIGIIEKGPNDYVTGTDIAISNLTVRGIFNATGEGTITEEADYTPEDLWQCLGDYTDDPVWAIDPADSTNNYRWALLSNPNLSPGRDRDISNVMVSIARLAGGRPTVGALLAPLLGVPPILLAAEEGKGAFVAQNGIKTELTINTNVDTGILLVSEKKRPYIPPLQEMGFHTVGVPGFAFKLCCVLQLGLIKLFASQLQPEDRELILSDVPVVGMTSHSSKLYDHAAGKLVADETGAWARTPQGEKNIAIAPGQQGLSVAWNAQIGNQITWAMTH